MRILELTHEEIELITRALGIAEMKFNKARKDYIENLVNVRGVDSLTKTREEADFMLVKENEFCDLLLKIKNGDKDI
jgi:hypothetical protein